MRENNGEIELAKNWWKSRLPHLIQYNDLKGDLQVHSDSTDGTMSIEDMALASQGEIRTRIYSNNRSYKRFEINKWT